MKQRVVMTVWILASLVGTILPVVLIVRAVKRDRAMERFMYPRGR